ncbi:MFS transporter [Methyloraptor flagellatus]|uniref:MFS transporter n=1 Tax=Methyloraptor flagellatus TaxID=3162530 RepID=A0AAU7X3Q6_9HYPH
MIIARATTLSGRRLALVVAALGVTQIIGYGTLYYAYGVLSDTIGADLGLSHGWMYGAFSAGLLACGLFAPWSGRASDRFGPDRVLVAGSFAAALSLAALASASGPVGFATALIATQIASGFVLYETAFAALVELAGPTARRAITHLTLIAGFASTLFWPLTAKLAGAFDWRTVLFVYAALNALVAAPLHLVIVGARRRARVAETGPIVSSAPAVATAPRPDPGPNAEAETRERRPLVLMLVIVGFTLGGFTLTGLLAQLVPLLGSLGIAREAAVSVGMIFGPAQVASRLINMLGGNNLSPVTLGTLSSAMVVAGLAILILGGGDPIALVAFAVLYGAGSGIVSIARGTVPLAVWGPFGYASRLGVISSVRIVVSALAPFAVAAIADGIGAAAAIAVLIGLGALGVLAFVWLGRLVSERPIDRLAA